jgi:UDP-glucose 4-epimerase
VIVKLADHPQAAGQVFNIGSNQEIAIDEVANIVMGLTGSSSEIVYIPYDQAYEEGFEDRPRRVPDITKIQALLGFAPTLDIRAIVKKIIEYCQARLRQQKGMRVETRLPTLSWH